MRKVIVKLKLKSRDEFEKKITEMDKDFLPMYWLHERVYVPRNYRKKNSFPRLILKTEMHAVDRPAKYEMQLRRHIEDSGIDIIETTVIRDYQEAANMILQLGFEIQNEVSSRRQELSLEKGKRLILDKVDGISGYFAKIEAELTEEDKVEKVREEVLEIFSQLGQDSKNLVYDSYSEQM
jgi:CYTH domain